MIVCYIENSSIQTVYYMNEYITDTAQNQGGGQCSFRLQKYNKFSFKIRHFWQRCQVHSAIHGKCYYDNQTVRYGQCGSRRN